MHDNCFDEKSIAEPLALATQQRQTLTQKKNWTQSVRHHHPSFVLTRQVKRTAHQKHGENTTQSDLQKEDDVDEVGNYRSICIQSELHKLFSTLIYNRLFDRLDRAQTEDQRGFRRSYRGVSKCHSGLHEGI